MSFPKFILIVSIVVFSAIGVTAIVKKKSAPSDAPELVKVESPVVKPQKREESIALKVVESVPPAPKKAELPPVKAEPLATPAQTVSAPAAQGKDDFPSVDRIQQLFTTGPGKLPIVETVSYTSRVAWLKGRPAWIADYASYFGTSRHFIARSLNGKADYFSQKVSTGSRFNVFRKDKNINFHLLIDLSRCKMAFYYIDLDANQRVLLKTYDVGLGRLDSSRPSGSLTPLGKYSLGNKIAIYKPGTIGYFQEQKVEMIQAFGTRWIPFDQALEKATAPAKGYGIHGAPWRLDPQTGELREYKDGIGKYDSDGCIRLASEDIEEIFAIVITKPTFVEIVKDFREARLPGVEVK